MPDTYQQEFDDGSGAMVQFGVGPKGVQIYTWSADGDEPPIDLTPEEYEQWRKTNTKFTQLPPHALTNPNTIGVVVGFVPPAAKLASEIKLISPPPPPEEIPGLGILSVILLCLSLKGDSGPRPFEKEYGTSNWFPPDATDAELNQFSQSDASQGRPVSRYQLVASWAQRNPSAASGDQFQNGIFIPKEANDDEITEFYHDKARIGTQRAQINLNNKLAARAEREGDGGKVLGSDPECTGVGRVGAFGQTPYVKGLARHHIISSAALIQEGQHLKLQIFGRDLTPEEEIALHKAGPVITIPNSAHLETDTYFNKNTNELINDDALHPGPALERDLDAIRTLAKRMQPKCRRKTEDALRNYPDWKQIENIKRKTLGISPLE